MKKIVSHAKESFPFVVFAAFAVLIARALHFCVPGGDDWLFAVKAEEGFLGAVAYGARYLGEGICGAFLRVALNELPVVIWKIVCTAAFLFSDVAAALIVSRAASKDRAECGAKKRRGRFGSALVFTTAAFALIPLSVLREGVFSIAGTVHFVIPGALLLAAFLLLDRASENARGSAAAPLITLVAALLSWQAALGAIVICAVYVVRSARKREFRFSYALSLAAAVGVFGAHYLLWNVPRFPDVSRLFALRSFFAEAFDEGGFFVVIAALSALLSARTLCENIIPALRSKERQGVGVVFRFALCFASAANALVFVLHSTLVPHVIVPGTLTVLCFAITLLLFCVDLILSLRDGGGAEALFSLAAFVCAAATLPTYTFGGDGFYLPIVLAVAVLASEFLKVRRRRAAIAVLGALGAYYAASLCLTKGKVMIAAAVIVVCFIVELSPIFRRPRLTEALAVILILLTIRGIGSDQAAYAAIAGENERRIGEAKDSGAAFIVLKGESPGEYALPWYREYYGIADGAEVYFAGSLFEVPDDLGDVNGDGKVNSVDRLLFMKLLGD